MRRNVTPTVERGNYVCDPASRFFNAKNPAAWAGLFAVLMLEISSGHLALTYESQPSDDQPPPRILDGTLHDSRHAHLEQRVGGDTHRDC
jgi:hypothetical protein